MALDPQVRTFLDQLALLPAPPIDELPLDEARQGLAVLNALGPPPVDLPRVEDLVVPGPDGAVPVRAYWPATDPARMAVAGDSAGGDLAAVVALRARDEGGPPLVAQLLVYPFLDPTMSRPSVAENGEGYLLTERTMRWFWRLYLDGTGPDEPWVTPLTAQDLSRLPPALVVTAGYDPLRDEGEEYAGRLADAGVPVALRRWPGMIHAFFTLGLFDAAQEAVAEAVTWLEGRFTT